MIFFFIYCFTVITHEGEPDVITLSSDNDNDDDDDDDGGDDYSYDGVREKHEEEETKLDGECSAVVSSKTIQLQPYHCYTNV